MNKLLKSFTDEMVAPQTNKIEDDNLLEILSGVVPASSQFLKILSGLYKGVVGFSNYFFARKACKFLSDISDLDVQKRYKFVGEIAARGKDNAGYIFMSLLERLENINKVEIMSNLFRACVLEDINVDDFFRTSAILERTPYIDLNNLQNYQNPHFDIHSTASLFSSGAISLYSISKGKDEDDKYILTYAGYIILKYGLKQNISYHKSAKIMVKGIQTHKYSDGVLTVEEY